MNSEFENAQGAALEARANDSDFAVRIAVASNPSTPPSVLAAMATDDAVQFALAGNTSAPAETLRALADLESAWNVHAALAGNPHTPADILSQLATVRTNSGHRYGACVVRPPPHA